MAKSAVRGSMHLLEINLLAARNLKSIICILTTSLQPDCFQVTPHPSVFKLVARLSRPVVRLSRLKMWTGMFEVVMQQRLIKKFRFVSLNYS